jgi:putative aminopeptidase FrvX
VPVRYIHAPVSLAKKSDIDYAISLLKAVIEKPLP